MSAPSQWKRTRIAWFASLCLFAGAALAGEGGFLTAEEAEAAALAQTGGGKVVEIDKHSGGDSSYYRLEILGDDGNYHVEIDADTGKLLQLFLKGADKLHRKGRVLLHSAAESSTDRRPLSLEEATTMALALTGGGAVVDTDVEYKRRRRIFVYEFEIRRDDSKYEVEIDSLGNIREFEKDGRRLPLPAAPRPAAPSSGLWERNDDASTTSSSRADLDLAEIQRLALEKVGGGTVVEYRADSVGGRGVHSVAVVRDGRKHYLEIDDDATARELRTVDAP